MLPFQLRDENILKIPLQELEAKSINSVTRTSDYNTRNFYHFYDINDHEDWNGEHEHPKLDFEES